MLEEFLERKEVAVLLAKDFVICGIDQDVMVNGKTVASAIRKGVEGGIPWFVIFDPSKPVITKVEADGSYARREAAILATADGPNGNVGCPMAKEERTHFLACLSAARKNLDDEALMFIAEQQRAFAAERNEQYGEALDGMPKPPVNFAALQAVYIAKMEAFSKAWEAAQNGEGDFPEFPDFKQDFNDFRALAKNYLAAPDDRGQAYLWCLENVSMSGIVWKNPGKVMTGLANTLIDNWYDAPWAEDLPMSLSYLGGDGGFDAAAALMRLEGKFSDPKDKVKVAYARANINRGYDNELWVKDVEAFIKAYPNSQQAKELAQAIEVMSKLKVGELAPTLAGTSVDGAPIALSDYKGKVVFLVFWGFW